jgi:hypothetical protein
MSVFANFRQLFPARFFGAKALAKARKRYIHVAASSRAYTALGSDGQGPKGFSFIFLDLFDFFDLFADLARACLGFLERPSTLVRGRAST